MEHEARIFPISEVLREDFWMYQGVGSFLFFGCDLGKPRFYGLNVIFILKYHNLEHYPKGYHGKDLRIFNYKKNLALPHPIILIQTPPKKNTLKYDPFSPLAKNNA